jgi:hypothetical protein
VPGQPCAFRRLHIKKQSKKSELLTHFLIGIRAVLTSKKKLEKRKKSPSDYDWQAECLLWQRFFKIFSHFSGHKFG